MIRAWLKLGFFVSSARHRTRKKKPHSSEADVMRPERTSYRLVEKSVEKQGLKRRQRVLSLWLLVGQSASDKAYNNLKNFKYITTKKIIKLGRKKCIQSLDLLRIIVSHLRGRGFCITTSPSGYGYTNLWCYLAVLQNFSTFDGDCLPSSWHIFQRIICKLPIEGSHSWEIF